MGGLCKAEAEVIVQVGEEEHELAAHVERHSPWITECVTPRCDLPQLQLAIEGAEVFEDTREETVVQFKLLGQDGCQMGARWVPDGLSDRC